MQDKKKETEKKIKTQANWKIVRPIDSAEYVSSDSRIDLETLSSMQ